MPTPLRTSTRAVSEAVAPEALLISALVEAGQFRPDRYHIEEDDPEAWRAVWDFCTEYQRVSGCAPPLHLLKSRYPDFEYTPEVNPDWAASELRKAAYFRSLREHGKHMLAAVHDEDLEGAYDAVATIAPPRTFHKPPASVFDNDVLTERFDVTRIEVPYPSLARATGGGIEAGEFWVLAMRLAQGKSYVGSKFCARAAELGWRVAINSFEMPARQMVRRTLRHLAGRDGLLLRLLDSEEEKDRKKAIAMIAERTPGVIDVYDHTMGKINTLPHLRDVARDYDFTMVDHLGLMVGPDGRRAIDDWHVAGHVSNAIREITLAENVSILGIVQVNRAGEHPGSAALPRPSELAQTDAYGQDAVVIITGKRLSARVLKMGTPKVREGQNVTWYTRFDPANNRFEEISKEDALDMGATDVDRESFT